MKDEAVMVKGFAKTQVPRQPVPRSGLEPTPTRALDCSTTTLYQEQSLTQDKGAIWQSNGGKCLALWAPGVSWWILDTNLDNQQAWCLALLGKGNWNTLRGTKDMTLGIEAFASIASMTCQACIRIWYNNFVTLECDLSSAQDWSSVIVVWSHAEVWVICVIKQPLLLCLWDGFCVLLQYKKKPVQL